jgi:Clostridium epsilon toxin ETX/Bacillus mosquitocidal toxin MTX2
MAMASIDVGEVLKSKFLGKKLLHKPTGTTWPADGWNRTSTVASGTWSDRIDFRYEDLEFDNLKINYDSPKQSNLPLSFIKRRWILENYTDVPDKKAVTLTLSFTESVTAGLTKTITSGINSTFKVDASYQFSVKARVSAGYTEAITLSTTTGTSKQETRSSTKTESYDFGYEIPPKRAAIVDLVKEIIPYEMKFEAKMIVDGYFGLIVQMHNLSDGYKRTENQPLDKNWGMISDYLTEEERTITIVGIVEELVGETTRRTTKFVDLENDINLEFPMRLELIVKPAEAANANIRLISLNSTIDFFEAIFEVDTGVCTISACSGFDATLVFELEDGQRTNSSHSFAGWSQGETNSQIFSITRNGVPAGVVVDIIDIETPVFECYD